MPYPEIVPKPPISYDAGGLILLVEQNDTVFGIDLSRLGGSDCKCAETGEGGGSGTVNGINAFFFKRLHKDETTGLIEGRRLDFDGEIGSPVTDVNMLDDPPTENQTGPVGNVELTRADGLKIYFVRRFGQKQDSGLWDVETITSAGKPGKRIEDVLLLDALPSEDQTGSTLNAVLTSVKGLKVYFGKRTERDHETGRWTVQTKTTNGADGIVVDSVRFLDEEEIP